ncbi:MAG: hypothetical protein H6707_19190 [Deltaproteobacteria bacterium]|nr:hypothetical protein [Deltaproteobacteria bacterium]
MTEDTAASRSAALGNQTAMRLVFWPKRLLFFAVFVVCTVLLSRAELGLGRTLAITIACLFLLDSALRPLIQRQLRRLDRELLIALQQGADERLRQRYRSYRFLRLVGPKHELLERRGRIEKQLGAVQAAIEAYLVALDEAPRRDVPELARKLADLLYESQRYEAAERYYRISQDDSHANAGVRARIARLVIERGGDPREAELFLRQAIHLADDAKRAAVFRCQLIPLLAERNAAAEAAHELALVEQVLANSADSDDLQPLYQQTKQSLSASRGG